MSKAKIIREKFSALREMRLLPMSGDLDFENWLDNFHETAE